MADSEYRDPRIEAEIEAQWRAFWLPIVAPSGIVDIEQVKRELFDFKMVMDRVCVAYDDLTCGRISKITTDAEHVISQARECFERSFTEDLIERIDDRIEDLRAKSDHWKGARHRIAELMRWRAMVGGGDILEGDHGEIAISEAPRPDPKRAFIEDLIERLDTKIEETRAQRNAMPSHASDNRRAAAGYLEALKDIRAELQKELK